MQVHKAEQRNEQYEIAYAADSKAAGHSTLGLQVIVQHAQ